MAYAGEPDEELVDLLGQVELVQQTARKNLRAGTIGAEIFENADAALLECSARDEMFFGAHGMGIVSHEAPWLMPTMFPRYVAHHRDQPLEAGMVDLDRDRAAPHRARIHQARGHGRRHADRLRRPSATTAAAGTSRAARSSPAEMPGFAYSAHIGYLFTDRPMAAAHRLGDSVRLRRRRASGAVRRPSRRTWPGG